MARGSSSPGGGAPPARAARAMWIEGERRAGLFAAAASADEVGARGAERAALAYALGRPLAVAGAVRAGEVPLLSRPLRLAHVAERIGLPQALAARLPRAPLVAPFGGRPPQGLREITTRDPRATRLWERFAVDVGVAMARGADWLAGVFERKDEGTRVLVVEDGDRYAIRALCVFALRDGAERRGEIVELLHDRSVAGMRAASGLLGFALRALGQAGAHAAYAVSLPHSGSFPMYARHAFLPLRGRALRLDVLALDAELEDVVADRARWYVSLADLPEPGFDLGR